VFVSATGTDNPACNAASPCATLAYAMNVVVNPMVPLSATVSLFLDAGTYGPASCGAIATRPVSISGAGSGLTVVDCAGSNRALYTNDSIAVVGITVKNGWVSSEGEAAVFGGGGIAVEWGPTFVGAAATIVDVHFVNNSALLSVSESTAGLVSFGGGGLWIHGGSNVSTVVLSNCAFTSNSAITNGTGAAEVHMCGGGACVHLGYLREWLAVTGVNVTERGSVASGNMAKFSWAGPQDPNSTTLNSGLGNDCALDTCAPSF
jgi:hypothetical protein